MTTRRKFLQAAGVALAALSTRPALFAREDQQSEGQPLLQEFHYGDVTLDPGRAQTQFDQTQSVLMGMNEDSLLKPWRLRAGLPAPGPDMGGWYDVQGFAPAHSFGQWISALARGYAVNGNGSKKARVERLLDLYRSAISAKFYENFRFPAYDYDKVVCGLIDAHQFAGVQQAWAILNATTDAADPHLPPHALDRDAPQLAWRKATGQPTTKDYGWDEPYTLPENLYLAWQRGAGDRYKRMAGRYLLDKTWFDPLSEGVNVLPHHHAYSLCNSLSSAMQAWLSAGSQKHLRAAKNGFAMITAQSFATGGWGPNESFVEPGTSQLFDSLSKTHSSFETPCGSYAHFKLTRYLLRVTRDGRYGDSMERVFYNTVLGAKRLEPDGHAFYYSDYNFSAQRVYHPDRWPCCSGTLPQVAADYHLLPYFHEGDNLYVNLYLPSTLRWINPDGAQVTLQQDTEYPIEGRITMRLRVSHPSNFALRLRIPAWAGAGVGIAVNGEKVSPHVSSGFATLHRKWKNSDRIEVDLPLTMRLEQIDPSHNTVALIRGPLVLFAETESSPKVRQQQLLQAQRGRGAEWFAHTNSGKLRLVPFTELGENKYSGYLNLA